MDQDNSHILYIQGSEPNQWFRKEWKLPCDYEGNFIVRKCQGVKGHDGPHWCFSSNGDYAWADNKKETDRGYSGHIPPGHTDYKSPLEMHPLLHQSIYVERVVTNPEHISLLNQFKTPEDGAGLVYSVADNEEAIQESLERWRNKKSLKMINE